MLKSVLRVLPAFFLCGVCAFAQLSGRLTGTVTDQSGAPVAGANVSVLLPGGASPLLTTTTSSEGIFAFTAVRPETYDLTIEAPGFSKFVNRGVKVDPARETSLPPAVLQVQQAATQIEVTSSVQAVQTTNAEISNTVTQKQIMNLPVLDRQVSTLFLTQPGVSSGRGPTVINGMRTSAANVTLDGINIQDNFIRTNALDYIPNKITIEQVAEMTIATSNATASTGLGGAQIVLATPSGTNTLRGSLYWYNRNSEFAANDWFNNKAVPAVKRPFLNQNQVGGSAGGKIIRDKLFFYTNYEAFRNRQQSPQTNTILTPNARTGVFSYKDSSGAVRSANILGLKNLSIDPAVAALLSQVPTAGNSTDAGDQLNTTGYSFNARANEDRNVFLGKIDYYLSSRHMFSTTYEYNTDVVDRPDISSAGGTFYGLVPPVFNDNHANFSSSAWRWTVSPTFTNEVRAGANWSPGTFAVNQKYPAYLISEPIFTNPVNSFMAQGRATDTYGLQDNASWVKGRHTMSFGYQAQFVRTAPYNDAGIVPTYTLGISTGNSLGLSSTDLPGISSQDLAVANNLLATLAGIQSSASQTFNVTSRTSGFVPGATNLRHFSYDTHSGYLQDNFRVLPRLTLNLGLRYDYYTQLQERDSLYLLPRLENNNYIQTLMDPNAVLDFAGNSVGRPYYKKDLNNFAPNVGLAWDVFGNGKTALRAGYGIFYLNDDTITAIRNNITTNSGLSSAVTLNSLKAALSSGLAPITTPAFKVPRTLADNYAISTGSAAGLPNPDLVTPYVQQYNVGIQHEVKGAIFEVRYLGNHGVKLFRAFDYNQVNINAGGFFQDFLRARSNGMLSLAATGGKTFDPRYNAAIPGSQQLTVFPQLTGGGLLTNSTVQTYIRQGEPGTLAEVYQTNGLNGPISFFNNPNILGANTISNYSNSNYNSLQVDVRKRAATWLQWQANYTFSKVLSDEAGNDQNRFEPFLDINNPSLEKAPAPFDIRHVAKGNYVLDLPVGKGRKFSAHGFLDAILGGWSTSGIVTWQSGTPFSILSTRGTLNRGARSALNTAVTLNSGADLGNVVGFFMTGNGPYFINPSAINSAGRGAASDGSAPFSGQVFFNPAPGTLGTLQRRSFYGPNFFNMDSSLLKTFHITERQTVQFRADAFNLLNHPEFYVGNETSSTSRFNINSTSFGKIVSTLDQVGRGTSGRVMQFGLYYRF